MAQKSSSVRPSSTKERNSNDPSPSNVVALDCEMVGVGPHGKENRLARVSIVDLHGTVIYDEYVLPEEPITNYRTEISGITPEHLQNGLEFSVVQKRVGEILKKRIIVGHSLHHDFEVLRLSHPNIMTRDTSYYRPFREMFEGRSPSLKNLALQVLSMDIQQGQHSSVQDARVAMKIYLKHRREWENEVKLALQRRREAKGTVSIQGGLR